MDEFQQAQDQIGQAKTGEADVDQALKAHAERKLTEDRSFIVKWVVYLYVFSIALGLLYLTIQGLWFGEDRFRDLSELIKIAVVPVLTLVIGYYFGTSRSY